MSKTIVPIEIVTCPEWKAAPAKKPPVIVAKAKEIIFHHTDGHHPEISNPKNESLAESVKFAKNIQTFHMAPKPKGRGWNDSGHNFLVCRNGVILQGRWYTVTAIEHGHMVESAHCPTRNHQVGIEHEHAGKEEMTPEQIRASARLQAWIAGQYMRKSPLPVSPHSKYYNTACPANLIDDIDRIRNLAAQILKGV